MAVVNSASDRNDPGEAVIPETIRVAVIEELAPRFRHLQTEHPAARALFDGCVERTARQRMHSDAGRT